MVIGIQTSSSIMSCPFGLCHRVNAAGQPGTKGRWVVGEARTMRKCGNLHDKWITETGANKDKLRLFGGCKSKPIPLFDDSKLDTPFIQLFVPPILHCLLGNQTGLNYLHTFILHFFHLLVIPAS